MKYYLAIDIGASSGRHILGHMENGHMVTEEIWRFENKQIHKNGHDCWDMDNLWYGILGGLKACKAAGKIPATMGIDTWAVDYVLLDEKDQVIGDAVAYRDSRTEGMKQWVNTIIPAEELELTIGAGGYSTMNFAFPVKLAGAGEGKAGLIGYVAGEDDGTSIEMFDAVYGGYTDGSENVPANTPLIVQGTDGATYTLQILNEEVTNHPNQGYLDYNSLSGTLMSQSFEAGHGKNIYGIATVNGHSYANIKKCLESLSMDEDFLEEV